MGEEVDGEELSSVLKSMKASEIAQPFGRHVEKILNLWGKIEEEDLKNEIIKLILDLQTSNSPSLAALTLDHLTAQFGQDPYFNDKIRLIGLKKGENFQGALSNYELLTHMKKGNYVFHLGGWGVGEVIDISFLREQLAIEFDYVPGERDLSFQNAFKMLLPISSEHFLAQRFGNPEALEDRAKKEPVEVIHILLRDLGPSTASEIREELRGSVIPEKEWGRWWQMTRAKIKKSTKISMPKDSGKPLVLREVEVTHEERLRKALEKTSDVGALIHLIYTFLRDFPQVLKNKDLRVVLREYIENAISSKELTDAQELQLHFLMEDLQDKKEYVPSKELIKRFASPEDVVSSIKIMAFKKRMLVILHALRDDWEESFLNLLLSLDQNFLRDYVLTELLHAKKEGEVMKKLDELLVFPTRFPSVVLWYFQKIMKSSHIPYADQEGRNRFFESFLILLSSLEQIPGNRELIKKMLKFLTAGRYSNVRKIFQKAPKPMVQEFLLLSTKCHSLSDHDIKIFHSLAEIVHPSLAKLGKKYSEEEEGTDDVIWATEKGYQKIQERLRHLAGFETIENAKEIEVACSHGDLRENAEFKAAIEKRSRLQSEMKLLSAQLNKARIITQRDIATDIVGVGVMVDCQGEDGSKETYTLLGPWEADPDKHILSFQSKLAQSLIGRRVGDTVSIQGKNMTISNLRNYFEHE